MLTYQDLLAVGADERARMDFILKSISEHTSSAEYKTAQAAELYYNGENPTINNYEKIIYDQMGKAHVDMWTANHKIASSFFTFVVDQEVSYLLGNGVRFNNNATKAKLGKNFDENVQDALEYAIVSGSAFGFWNLDHIEVFKSTEFMPYLDEETGAIKAGLRHWQLADNKPLRATLYELDGYTEYIRENGKDMRVLTPKKSYKQTTTSSEADGMQIVEGSNYNGFPVVPLYANKAHKSALTGKRNTVDALDLASSNMVNNVDEGNLIYWVLTNCGGMDDLDDVQFVERLKTLHVAHTDGSDGATATAHSVEAPYEGTKTTIDMLTNRLYDDFQAFNAAAVTASNQSATAIRASYIPLDLKCDKIERQVTRFINGILALAGINDSPSYTRNQLINKLEETQMLIMQSQYFDEEYTRKKLLTINGDVDMYDEISDRVDAEDANRLRKAESRISEGGNLGNE